jgi:predicted nucleotidyltransferase
MSNLEFYTETLKALNEYNVKYLVVGGFAVNSYGYMRSTGDLDLWIRNDHGNLRNISKALKSLKYKESDIEISINELKNNKNISLIHNRFFKIELISFLSSTLQFDKAFLRKKDKKILGTDVMVIDINDLIYLKIKSGREKDLLDIYELQKIKNNKH